MSQSFDGSQNDLVLTLPDDIEVKDLKWISIWCRRFELTFGDFVFPEHSDGEDDVPRQDVVKPQKKPGTLQKYIILNIHKIKNGTYCTKTNVPAFFYLFFFFF